MNLQPHFSKTASGKKFLDCPIASGVNRPARRAASRVWASRRKNRVGVICYADHLGTPRAITRPSDNAKVWEWKNDEPFGANAANENPSGLGVFSYNLRFPGQFYDQETGTHYNYFRDYDPSTGRYVQSDPIGLKGGINTYGYVGGAPLSMTDPLGLEVKWTGGTIGFGATMGGGGQITGFQFTSECKCDRVVTVTGFASFINIGAGLSLPKLKLDGTGSGLTMYSLWSDCPDASDFNGPAANSGINAVVGAGSGFLSSWVLGKTRSGPLLTDGPAYGLDVGLTYSVLGWSTAVASKIETKCCR